jgi:hypothetical protein
MQSSDDPVIYNLMQLVVGNSKVRIERCINLKNLNKKILSCQLNGFITRIGN